MPPPEVHAKHVHQALAFARAQLDATTLAAYLAAAPDAVRAIEAAPSSAWLPAAHAIALADALLATLGPARTHAHQASALPTLFREARWGGLARGGMRLFGITPASFAEHAGKAWETMYRGCGVVTGASLGKGRARIAYAELPAIAVASDAWVASLPAAAEGILGACGVTGEVTCEDRGRAQGELVIELAWR